MKMKPSERIIRCFYDWNRKLLISIGHDIFVESFAPNLLEYFLYSLVAVFFIGFVNTVMNYDLVIVLRLLSISCIPAEVSMFE